MNKDIVEYLKEGKKRGFSSTLLKKKLLEGGFSHKEIEEAANSLDSNTTKNPTKQYALPNLERSASGNGKIGMLGRIGKAIAHPVELFEKTKGEGIWLSLRHYWIVSIVPFVLLSLIVFFALGYISDFVDGFTSQLGSEPASLFLIQSIPSSSIIILAIFIWIFIGSVIMQFIFSGILHLFVKLYRGKGRYGDTFSAGVYSYTPLALFGLIPFVNGIVGIWSFVLMLYGLSIKNYFSKWRAFFAMLSLFVLTVIIWLVVFLLFN